jgi:hypothetical protein
MLARRAFTKAVAATLVLIPAGAYNVLAAYGFASREQATVAQRIQDAEDRRSSAEARVRSARQDLEAYQTAPEPDVIAAKIATLKRCRCPALEAAKLEEARAKAKVRLRKALEEAEEALSKIPPAPPKDSRAERFGREAVAWLPVILLEIGALFGMFATTPPGRRKTETAAPPPAAKRQAPASSVVSLVAKLAANPSAAPAGIKVDAAGWVRAGQRQLAALLGVPLARCNREIKAAVAAGRLALDTRHGTALRVS